MSVYSVCFYHPSEDLSLFVEQSDFLIYFTCPFFWRKMELLIKSKGCLPDRCPVILFLWSRNKGFILEGKILQPFVICVKQL